MAGVSHLFASGRGTEPDPAQLLTLLRAIDATIGVDWSAPSRIRLKKNSAWTAPQITSAQTVLDTAPAASPQLAAQAQIDVLPIAFRALVLALVDAINILRTHAAIGLPAVTPAQAWTSIRNKAGTL